MTTATLTGLEVIEAKLGKTLLDDSGNALKTDEVNVTDGLSVLASVETAVTEFTSVIGLDDKVTKGYLAVAECLAVIRSLIIVAATGLPDWIGNTQAYKAIAREIYSQAFAGYVDSEGKTIPVEDTRRNKLLRGVQNQMSRGVLELAIRNYVIASNDAFADGKELTAKGIPTKTFKDAMSNQFNGQGTFASGKNEGKNRLTLPVIYGGATPEDTHTPTSAESKTAKLADLLVIATSRTDGEPTIAPLVNARATHRMLTDQCEWAMRTNGASYADSEDTKAVYAKCEELLSLIVAALDGSVTTADTTAAFEANCWTAEDGK